MVRMPTASDIARLANVSRSTISRVVNDYPNVPAETRRRVLQVIQETGYVPHHQARHLAGVRSKVLLLYVDNRSDYYTDKIAGSSFFGPIITYLIDSANRRGYDAIVTQSAAPHSWSRARDLLYGRMAAGAVFLGIPNKDPRLHDFHLVPTVVVDHKPLTGEAWSAAGTVNFDNIAGMADVISFLREQGRQRIGYITGNLRIYSGLQRLQGFRKALSDAGIEGNDDLIIAGDFSEQSGYEGARQLLSLPTRPDAIVASDDECGIGVLRALEEAGITVPEEMNVVGFDDIELSRYVRPALTTVSAPKREVADRAIELLLDLVEARDPGVTNVTIPTALVRRMS